jgi:hypothetical protein
LQEVATGRIERMRSVVCKATPTEVSACGRSEPLSKHVRVNNREISV